MSTDEPLKVNKRPKDDVDDESKTPPDINHWLQENRLTKFKQYFEETETILSDLLKYKEEDIELIIIEIHARFMQICKYPNIYT